MNTAPPLSPQHQHQHQKEEQKQQTEKESLHEDIEESLLSSLVSIKPSLTSEQIWSAYQNLYSLLFHTLPSLQVSQGASTASNRSMNMYKRNIDLEKEPQGPAIDFFLSFSPISLISGTFVRKFSTQYVS